MHAFHACVSSSFLRRVNVVDHLRSPGPGVSSPDRLALAKEVQKKAGGKFKGGNRVRPSESVHATGIAM